MNTEDTPEPTSRNGNEHSPTRRHFIAGAAAVAAVATVHAGTSAHAAAPPMAPALARTAFAVSHVPRALPFDSGSLRGLSKALLDSHWTNNYGGAVRTLNAVKTSLQAASADETTPAYAYSGLKREHLLRAGSVVLHDLYFANLGGSGRPSADVRAFVAESFGSFDAWEQEFRRIAAGLAGGSGWVVLAYSAHFGTLENYWLADHMHFPAGTTPLLVLDMYEHAYQIDFGAAAGRYIDAAFQNFNWEVVGARMAACRGTEG